MKKFEVYQEIHWPTIMNLKPQNKKLILLLKIEKRTSNSNLQYDEKVMLKLRMKTSMWKNG